VQKTTVSVPAWNSRVLFR